MAPARPPGGSGGRRGSPFRGRSIDRRDTRPRFAGLLKAQHGWNGSLAFGDPSSPRVDFPKVGTEVPPDANASDMPDGAEAGVPGEKPYGARVSTRGRV